MDRKPLAKMESSEEPAGAQTKDSRWIVRLTDEESERYWAQSRKFKETRSEWMRRTLAIGASVRESMPAWKTTVA